MLLAVIAASVVILTAGYILWTVQRVYLGPEYKGPHGEAITHSTPRENAIAGVLFALAILMGLFPYQTVLRYMDRTVERQVKDLAAWTARIEAKPPAEQDSPPLRAAAHRTERVPAPQQAAPERGPQRPWQFASTTPADPSLDQATP
jgi:hypothetical protein